MSKETILIVDDDKINITVVAEILRVYYDIKIATNGADALKLIQKETPDLVLLDIVMPDMNGFEVASMMKHTSSMSDIPIIFLTGRHDPDSIAEGFQSGAADYIHKPFLKEELLIRIDNHLQLKKLKNRLSNVMGQLHVKVEEEIAKREEKEKMLYQQSKLAAIGEMMDAVAHQWRQPVNIIKMQVDLMGYDYEDKLIDKQYIQEFQTKIFDHIDHIENTLQEFRTFFRPNKQMQEFDVEKMIEKVLLLIKDELLKNKITVTLNTRESFTLNGIENEFKHLLINLLNNAKDAFIENNIENRHIQVNLLSDEESKTIEIIDNAGGIPENIIGDIFKANFTTKAEDTGTGIGLYMSSQIAQKHNGTLEVENVKNGAKFTFHQKILTELYLD